MRRFRHKPSRWHKDRSILLYPGYGMMFIYRGYRELGAVIDRDPLFQRWKWGTVPYKTKHKTFDQAVELILERDASGS